jgi:flagellar basal body rod protein FlgB
MAIEEFKGELDSPSITEFTGKLDEESRVTEFTGKLDDEPKKSAAPAYSGSLSEMEIGAPAEVPEEAPAKPAGAGVMYDVATPIEQSRARIAAPPKQSNIGTIGAIPASSSVGFSAEEWARKAGLPQPEGFGQVATEAADTTISLARAPGQVVSLASDIGQFLTAGTLGKDTGQFFREIDKTFETGYSIEHKGLGGQLAQLVEAGDTAGVAAFLAQHPKFTVDVALPSVGSMALGVGGAAGAARLAANFTKGRTAADAAKIAESARTWGAGGSNVLMNAGNTYAETGSYESALVAGVGTILANKFTKGGAEAAIASNRAGAGVGGLARTGINTGLRETGQEFFEGGSQAIGGQMANNQFEPGKALAQGTMEGIMGGVLGGGAGVATYRPGVQVAPSFMPDEQTTHLNTALAVEGEQRAREVAAIEAAPDADSMLAAAAEALTRDSPIADELAAAGLSATPIDEVTQKRESVPNLGDLSPATNDLNPATGPIEIDAAAAEAATSPSNNTPEPTEAQKEAGNYKLGHTIVSGLNLSIENEAGTHRRPEWPQLNAHYGYIRRTTGADGDHVDTFVKPGTPKNFSGDVYVVDQISEDGKFDEHKVMLGYSSREEAEAAYLGNYTPGWNGIGAITEGPFLAFKDWILNGDHTKPLTWREGDAAPESLTGRRAVGGAAGQDIDGETSNPAAGVDRQAAQNIAPAQSPDEVASEGKGLDGEGAVLSRPDAAPVQDEALESPKVKRLRKKIGKVADKVQFVEDVNDPRMAKAKRARSKSGREGRVEGYFDGENVVVLLPNIRARHGMSEDETVAWVANHENMHYGEKAATPESKAMLAVLDRAATNDAVSAIKAARKNIDKSDSEGTQEAMAEIGAALETGRLDVLLNRYGVEFTPAAEKGLRRVWESLLLQVRRTLRALGINSKLTNREIADILRGWSDAANDTDQDTAEAGTQGLRDGGRVRGSAESVDVDRRALDSAVEENPLEGLPRVADAAPFAPARRAAEEYMKSAGMEYAPPKNYVKIDPARGKRLADEFAKMEHAPDDPYVASAYELMIKETLAQYQEVKATGLKVEFIEDGIDPYAKSPRMAIADVVHNNHLWVFPTDSGFGSSELDVSQNPLLAFTGETISGKVARANDIFRVVHDYFGHIKEGVGFRAEGEENAWQSHAAMYSPHARRAMTTETRGQNSWLNFGPHAEHNKTATAADTIYADQKTGLMPAWTSEEGADADLQFSIADGDTVSTRNATAKKREGNPEVEAMHISLKDALRAGQAKRLAGVIRGYVTFKPTRATSDEAVIEQFVEQMKGNLKWLYNRVPEHIREQSKKWYVGANKTANKMAKEFGFTPMQAAAITAALSPQNDWDNNVSLARRVMDIIKNKSDVEWDAQMSKTALRIFGGKRYDTMRNQAKGKKLGDIKSPVVAAMWLRVYDETHGDREYAVNHPAGYEVGSVRNESGSLGQSHWNSLEPIANAISIARDGSHSNISQRLGKGHKVRNFHNNIASPNDEYRNHVTIDTHAVGAAHLMPLSSSDIEAAHNFGKTYGGIAGPGGSTKVGSYGAYALYHEAYVRAANELGVLPRELQSITWEAVRGLFPGEHKPELYGPVKENWKHYTGGKQSIEDARDSVLEITGGINEPVWIADSGVDGREQRTADTEQLAGDQLRGSADEDRRGDGSTGAGEVRVGIGSVDEDADRLDIIGDPDADIQFSAIPDYPEDGEYNEEPNFLGDLASTNAEGLALDINRDMSRYRKDNPLDDRQITEIGREWAALGKNKKLYQFPFSSSDELGKIAKDMAPAGSEIVVRKARPLTGDEKRMFDDNSSRNAVNEMGAGRFTPTRAYEIKVPVEGENFDKVATVYEDGDALSLNISTFQSGKTPGALIYQIVGTYAKNTNRKFLGDPLGLSEAALFRRTENMLVNALRTQSTKHLFLHPYQTLAGIKWRKGDMFFNIGSMATWLRDTMALYSPENFGDAQLQIKAATAARVVRASQRPPRGIPDEAGRGTRTVRRAAVTETIEERVKRGQLSAADDEGFPTQGGALDSVSDALVPGTLDEPILYSSLPDSETLVEARRRAGLSPDKRTLARRVSDSVSKFWDGVRHNLRRENIEQGIANPFMRIHTLEQRTLGNLPAEQRAYVAARLSTGVPSMMNAIMLRGAPQWKDGIVQMVPGSKGLLEVFEPVKKDFDDFIMWMVGRRAQALKRLGKENNLEQQHIDALLARARGKEELFTNTAREFAEFKRRILDLAEGAGLIDATTRPMWDQADWIPFYRAMDDERVAGPGKRKGLSGQSSGIRELKGGTDALNDPLENILMNFSHLLDASMKNKAMLQTIDNLTEAKDANGDPIIEREQMARSQALVPMSDIKRALRENGVDEATINAMPPEAWRGIQKMWTMQAPTDPDVTRVMRDGKAEYYRINDPLLLRSLTAVSGANPYGSFEPIVKPFRAFKRLLTRGVTATPDFMARNFIRDTMSAHMITKARMMPIAGAAKGAWDAYRKKDGALDMMFAGGSFLGGFVNSNDPTEMAEATRRALRKKGWNALAINDFMSTIIDTPVKLWEVYEDVGASIENASRTAVYDKVFAETGNKAQAVFEAKDLMDFSQRGDFAIMQLLGDVLPFFNARVQGLYKLGRAASADGRNPGAVIGRHLVNYVAVRSLLFITLPTIALMAINDGEDWYEELEEWDKDTYWHFRINTDLGADDKGNIRASGKGTHFRIPKPFELGVLFATYPERIYRRISKSDDTRTLIKQIGWNIKNTLAIDPVPQAVRPIVEAYANKSMFTGRPIESDGDESKLASARYTERTSNTARLIADKMPGVLDAANLSPKMIEHFTRGYLGEMGMYALGAADMAVAALTDAPVKPSLRSDQIPLLKSFVRDEPAISTKWRTELYEMHREVGEIYRTIQAYRVQELDDKADALDDKNAVKLDERKALSDAVKNLGDIAKEQDEVMRSRELTAKQKRVKLDELIREANELAKEAVKESRPSFR